MLDRTDLLELMVADVNSAPDIYKPGNFWDYLNKEQIPELRRTGLKSLRSRRLPSKLATWSVDLTPILGQIDFFNSRILHNRISRKIPLWENLLRLFNKGLNSVIPISPYSLYDLRLEGLKMMAYECAKLWGEKVGAKSIDTFSASLIGDPEDVLDVDGRVYTIPIIYFYMRYIYCSQFLNWDSVHTMVELGGGLGRQIEILKKLYPEITFLVYDIPPALYIQEQYLKAVFPDSVISYEDTRKYDSLNNLENGKIYILGTRQFPLLKDTKIDLFWNAASFQEMEPDIVANYLLYINKHTENVFLSETMGGQNVAKARGKTGVLQKTVLSDYTAALSNFDMLDLSTTYGPFGPRLGLKDTFWVRQK